MKNMPEFIVHVSVELDDSMIEEKLRYSINEGEPTYSIGEAETMYKGSYDILGIALARLAEYCIGQSEK